MELAGVKTADTMWDDITGMEMWQMIVTLWKLEATLLYSRVACTVILAMFLAASVARKPDALT